MPLNPDLLLWAVPALPVLGHLAFVAWRRERQRRERLHGEVAALRDPTDWNSRLSRMTHGLASRRERLRLQGLLASAGWREEWQLNAFLLSKLVLLLLAGTLGLLWQDVEHLAQLTQPGPMFKILVLLFLAVRLPDWLLADRIGQRQQRIRASVPQALDLLIICAEAGLSLDEALQRVAGEVGALMPEVAEEFRATRSELLLLPDRNEALRRMGERSGVRELELLAGSLIQSLRYGTPLASALQTIAAESRARQVAELEEKAGKTAARVGIPLIVLVLFPLVVIVAAPALIALGRTLVAAGS